MIRTPQSTPRCAHCGAAAPLAGARMAFRKHVRLVVGREMGAALQRGFLDGLNQAAAAPQLLYVLGDSERLRDAVESGA